MRTEELAEGFLAAPDEGSHPGILLVHDVFGLTPLYREFAKRLAAEGFATLSVSLYDSEPVIEDPARWMRALDDVAILRTLQHARDRLAAHPAAAGRSIGITGFCMGGGYALHAACSLRGIAACVAFYGLVSHAHGILHEPEGSNLERKPRDVLAALPSLRCPVLGIYGDQDEFVPLGDVRALEAGIARAGQGGEVVIYPGAGHAFLNETRPAAYRPDDARDAWQRMVRFFRERLR